MSNLWINHQASLLAFVVVLLLIAAGNALSLHRLGRLSRRWGVGTAPLRTSQPHAPLFALTPRVPRVSVLVPARNEEANIGPCICSLLAQDYDDFQVLVLDDSSTDGTAAVLAGLQAGNPRLAVLQGRPLPEGWLGKHWACHQLAAAADGQLLLFTDADTRHHPATLTDAVTVLEHERADLLSSFVQEEIGSWAERLTVPVMNWAALSFLLFWLAYRLRIPVYSVANGQFMLFRRSAYDRIGGHAAVRADPVDDIRLAREVIAHGLRWRMANARDRVGCRMYRDWEQVREGFSKNLFAAFGYNIPLFLFVWVWLVVVYWEPITVLALCGLGNLVGLSYVTRAAPSLGLAAAAVACSLLHWGLVYRYVRIPLYLALFYPVSIVVFAAIAIRSLIVTRRQGATWKGRPLPRHKAA